MNEHSEYQRPVLAPPGGEKKVMLHSCCAPCSGEVIEAMVASGLEMEIFFYNPNIHPREEYELRKLENIRFASRGCLLLLGFQNRDVGLPRRGECLLVGGIESLYITFIFFG